MPSALKDSHKPLSGLSVRLSVLAFVVVAASVIVAIAYRYYSAQKEAIEHEVRKSAPGGRRSESNRNLQLARAKDR